MRGKLLVVMIRPFRLAQVNAMLYDWVCEGTMGAKMDCDFERLDLSTRPFLEKSMVRALPPHSFCPLALPPFSPWWRVR